MKSVTCETCGLVMYVVPGTEVLPLCPDCRIPCRLKRNNEYEIIHNSI